MKLGIKKATAIFLSVLIMGMPLMVSAEALSRNETVYVNMSSTGEPKSLEVVNWLDTTGKTNIKDKSLLENINVISDKLKAEKSGGQVSVDLNGSDTKNLFYSGNIQKDLPVKVEITYKLNNNNVDASELAGKSGDVEINIKLHNNTGTNKIMNFTDYISGKNTDFNKTEYTPFMAQVAIDIPLDRFRNVEAPDSGTVVVGKIMKLNWIVFPYPDTEVSVKLHTENFELDSISINLLPSKPPVTSVDVESGLAKLYDGVNIIDENFTKLTQGADEIHSGSVKLDSGFKMFVDGLHRIALGSKQISAGAPQLSDAVSQMESSIELLDKAQKAQIQLVEGIGGGNTQMIQALQQLAKTPGMEKSAQSLIAGLQKQSVMLTLLENGGKMEDGTDFPGIKVTDEGLQKLGSGVKSFGNGLEKAMEAVTSLNSGIITLDENSRAISSGVAKLSDGSQKLSEGLATMSNEGIAKLQTGISDGINAARKGNAELKWIKNEANEYTTFSGSKDNGPSKVEFVMQTESIKGTDTTAVVPDTDKPSTENEGFFNSISKFFRKLFGFEK
jgi:hypothetical protein